MRSQACTAAAVLAALVSLCGCGKLPVAEIAVPGLVATWGAPGRINGSFVKPRVIEVTGDNRLAIIDRSGRVQTFDFAGNFVSEFAIAHTERGYPTGMAVTPDGHLWIAETHAYRVAEYAQDGKELSAFGTVGTGDGQFVYVTDVAVSPTGKVFASDYGTVNRVQEFDRNGRFVRLIGGNGTAPGQFRRPEALAIAPDGSLLVADACNDRIQRFASDGKLLAVYGAPGEGQGQLRYPYGIAISPSDGMAYITEYGNCRVQRMTLDGKFMGTWGRRGGGRGELADPWSSALDGKGRLFILDTGNSRVVVIDVAAARWSTDPKG